MKAKVVATVAAVSLLYTGVWFFQASQIQKAVQAQYASLSFEDIQQKGFPFSVQIAMTNPQIKNEHVAASVAGELIADCSLFGSLKSVHTNGTIHISSPFDITVRGDTSLELRGNNDFSQGALICKDTLVLHRYLDIPTRYAADKLVLDYKIKELSDDRVTMAVDFTGTDIAQVFKKEGVNLAEMSYSQIVANNLTGVTQNLSLSMECDIPARETFEKIEKDPMFFAANKVPLIALKVAKFDGSSKVQNSSAQGEVRIFEADDKLVEIAISGAMKAEFCEGLYEATLESLAHSRQELEALYAAQDASYEMIKKALDSIEIMPQMALHLQKLGKVQTSGDIRVLVNKDTLNWNVAIDDLGFACDKYSVSLQAKALAAGLLSRSKATVTIKNAKELIADAVDFYNVLVPFANSRGNNPETQLLPADQSTANGLYAVVSHFGTKDADGNLQLTFSYSDNKILICGKTLEEAIPQAQSLWLSTAY